MIANGSKVWFQALLLLLISLLSVNVYSQDYYEQYTKRNGLPSNEIYDIHQDINGLIWIATDRGIATFNGSYFKTYDVTDGLPNNVVFEFFEQSDGTIWCTTITNELFYFHPDHIKFTPYKFNHVIKKVPRHDLRGLMINPDNSIVFSFAKKIGYCKISGAGELYSTLIRNSGQYSVRKMASGFIFIDSPSSELTDNTEHICLGDTLGSPYNLSRTGNYTLVANPFSYKLFEGENLIKKVEFENSRTLKAGQQDNVLWIGTSEGMLMIDQFGQESIYADKIASTCYFKDADGNVWIGTQSMGLLLFPNSYIQLVNQTKSKRIANITVDDKKNLLLQTNDGFVYSYSDNRAKLIDKYRTFGDHIGKFYEKDAKFLQYHSLVSTAKNQMYVRRYSDNQTESPLIITAIDVRSENGQIIYYAWETSNNKYNYKRIYDAEYFGNNYVLIRNEQLLILDKNSKIVQSKDIEILANELDVHKGKIYCATRGKGILIFDKDLKLVKQLNTDNGLPSNFVNELYFYKNELWACTGLGLVRISNLSTYSNPVTINASNGLTEEEVFDMEILNGIVYLGTHQGLFHFKLKDWNRITNSKAPLEFRLSNLMVNGKPKLSLTNLMYNQNSIEVGFDIISFIQKEGLSFRYKLKGFDKDWRETNDLFVSYKSLPPGDYEIVIQPMFNGVPRKETIRQKISILPPYYSTWWFILLIIVGIITGTWLFIRYRVFSKNQELIREILRFTMKRLRPKSLSFVVRSEGKDIRINSNDVLYAESNGNYLTIHTINNKVVIREKISNFSDLVPDKLEFVQVRRSVIVRKDKISGKNSDFVIVGDQEIKIGPTFRKDIGDIKL